MHVASFKMFVINAEFARRHPPDQPGGGPPSDPEGVGRRGHPPPQPHRPLLLVCLGAVDGE